MSSGPRNADIPEYLRVFNPIILRRLAISSFVLTLVLISIGVWQPLHFENDIARFLFCVSVATTLSVFYFVFFPEKIEFHLPLQIGTTLRIGGPIALWFVIVLFLWQWIPSPEFGRVFRPEQNNQPGGMYYGDYETTKIWVPSQPPLRYFLIKNQHDRGLYGIYIIFDRNVRTYKAKLQHDPYSPIDVTFSRDGRDTFDVSSFGKAKP